MKIFLKIFKALFILTLIINSLNIYATNLKYTAYTMDVLGNGNVGIKIKNMTQASQGSVNDYATRTKVGDRMGNTYRCR